MKKRLGFICALFLAWLPVLALQKPLFMAYHHALAKACSLTDYLQVIGHGLKLDCTVAGYLTILPLLLTLVSVWMPGAWVRKVLKGYFGITAILIAAIFSVDVALYGFWGFRLDATVLFYLQSPTEALASVPVGLFVGQFLFFLLYAFGIYWFLKRYILPLAPATKIEGQTKAAIPADGQTIRPVEAVRSRLVQRVRLKLWASLWLLLLGGILFIPIRGGVTTSTANVGMVYFSDRQFLNHSAINPCFSLLASLSKQQDFASQFDFFPEEKRQELFESLIPQANAPGGEEDATDEKGVSSKKRSGNGEERASSWALSEKKPGRDSMLLTTTRPNLLVILMESFSANAIEAVGGEAGITPNLNRLSREGILFKNIYANSFRTDRGIVSVLNGYLAQPTTSIMKYPAKSQTLPSLAKSLAKEGYTADMLYGGDINFTNMQSYFFSSGYSHITADRDFPLKSRLSKWGANDDVTFPYLYESIRNRRDAASPWFSTFLTLSSHEPFKVPFEHLENPYLNSVAFTDSCIGDFIDRLKTTPAWQNLLVIFISDHGFHYPAELTDYEPRRFHIPMLWIGGAVKRPAMIETYGSQTDLAATLLNQLGLPYDEFIFSKDILNPCHPHYAFYTFPNGFGFIDSTGFSVYNNENNRPLMESSDEGNALRIDQGKALLQTLYDDLGKR